MRLPSGFSKDRRQFGFELIFAQALVGTILKSFSALKPLPASMSEQISNLELEALRLKQLRHPEEALRSRADEGSKRSLHSDPSPRSARLRMTGGAATKDDGGDASRGDGGDAK